ncbi:MAG: hypothetical protein JWM47_326 [Acidimicrobiales bacterium]|nr:hypothetical protein [Acidimicrobiales bacterium]
MLEDGTYDAIVVDAEEGEAPGTIVVELAIAAGPHRGELVPVTATGLDRDPLDLLAVPATITVAGGVPSVSLEG